MIVFMAALKLKPQWTSMRQRIAKDAGAAWEGVLMGSLWTKCNRGGRGLLQRAMIAAGAVIGVLCATIAGTQAFDESNYPDWKGQWRRFESGGVFYDPSKPRLAQQ